MRATLTKRARRRTMTPKSLAFYKENADKDDDRKTIIYNLMCEKAKIWINILSKSVFHKASSKNTHCDLHKFMLFHLIENLSFDLPHTIYTNILRNLKGLGVLDNIYYVALMNKLLWFQGVYFVFNKMDEDSKHTLIVKGSVLAKQQNFSKINLKVLKVDLEQSLKEALEVDIEAIKKRK